MHSVGDPLSGLTVLSLEQATVLPYLTYRLAQDGARIVRLEHPVHCDPNRMIGHPFREGEEKMCSYFFAFNAGKQAVTINLKDARAQELLRRMLVELDVDVFATNQLPRNYASLGVDYDTLRAVKPDLIWVGITGFGPDSNDAAYDPILQARGGLMDLTGEPDGDPQVVGIPLPDMGTSEHTYGQVMKALYRRAVTGEGARIDIAMIDSTVSWLAQPVTMARTFGRTMRRRGNTHEFFGPVNVFPTADGYVYLALGNDAQWRRLIALAGFEGLADPTYDTNAGRIVDAGRLNARLAEVTRGFSTEQLIAAFTAATLAVGKVQDIDAVCADPMVRDKFLHSVDPVSGFEVTMAPPPVTTPWLRGHDRTMTFPPRHGEHNSAIYGGELSLSVDELTALAAEGVI
jgi:crotonobetainyl-CoA:carnitine CoA-transferase CaiB-like acyl-CoA transferase